MFDGPIGNAEGGYLFRRPSVPVPSDPGEPVVRAWSPRWFLPSLGSISTDVLEANVARSSDEAAPEHP